MVVPPHWQCQLGRLHRCQQ